MTKRMVVGVSGASGAIYGVRLLEILRQLEIETHLIISLAAEQTVRCETEYTLAQVRALADVVHPIADIGAACASGGFRAEGMIIAPCSMKTVAEIASGVTPTLLSRAADVMLKERRRLVLLARETPLSMTHLKSMLAVTEAGGVIAPPVPAFYARPVTLAQMVDHTLGRVLDLFGLDSAGVHRWRGG